MHCQYCHNRDTWEQGGGDRLCVTKVLSELTQFKRFYDQGEGGVTVTGGEPTLQSEFVTALFTECKNHGIHTCLDTNGFVDLHDSKIPKLLEVTDLVLLDIKQMDKQAHINLTGVSNEPVLKFARYLADLNKPVWIRHVVVPGLTDSKEVHALGAFIQEMKNVEKIELIPYHTLGKHKWEALGIDYPLSGCPEPTEKKLLDLKQCLLNYHSNIVT